MLYREHFGESHYSFDYKGVHFVALDNVSWGRPQVGPYQLAWIKADVGRFPKTAPIVVFTHRIRRPALMLRPGNGWQFLAYHTCVSHSVKTLLYEIHHF